MVCLSQDVDCVFVHPGVVSDDFDESYDVVRAVKDAEVVGAVRVLGMAAAEHEVGFGVEYWEKETIPSPSWIPTVRGIVVIRRICCFSAFFAVPLVGC